MPTTSRIQELIQAYAAGPDHLEAAVRGIPEEELRFTPGREHWSIHENVVHVTDAELVGAVRMRFVIAQPGATLLGFDQERWARAMHYSTQPLAEALRLFRLIRESTADVLRRAPGAAWEHTGTHTEVGPVTLEWLVEHFVDHVPYHLRTIAKRRRQYAEASRLTKA